METTTAQLIGIGVTLLFSGANAAFFIVIKFNDMLHLGKKVDELDKKLDKLIDNSINSEKEIVEMKARCEERHK